MYDFSVAFISALALLKYVNLRLKIDWDSKNRLGFPVGCSYLQTEYYVITFCCFAHVFVDSACINNCQWRRLRPSDSLGDLIEACVNNFTSLFE